ncbi:MAG: response regulator [Armatimonadetes bacterium]|nr:response regulator [Armatimonadota bacterium]
MNDVLNIDQLASYIQMSRASLYHLVAAGKIPGTKIGKQWRFSKSLIDKWLEGTSKHPASVLVVEDDHLIRDLIVNTLRDAGHRSTGAESVSNAFTLLREIQFDVLVLDLLLPDGTGLDIVNAATKLPLTPDIIIVTGHPRHELIDSIHSVLPYITVLSKPVKLKVLMELVARIAMGASQVSK